MKIVRFIPICFLFFTACNPSVSQEAQPITGFKPEARPDAVLIDVRTPEEFAEGHVPGAENINLFDEDFAQRFAKFDKKETIYVYCRSGNRSTKAQQALKKLGYTRVVNLKGGFLAWEAAGKPVEK